MKWTSGDSGSSLMHPGGNCIQCHADRGEGPRFVAAGTVHAAAHEANDCAGIEGAQVTLTDANQKEYTLTTNASGNFFLHAGDAKDFASPYTARISVDGVQRAMNTPQSSGACGSCHTAPGDNGAPGRIGPT
ncbi:carboxypeptidase regulatory-like domain-containing protein [Corallococcus sp. CA053C]|nr:carboxypeptidase regulatory-like domain-containing protein [Corallococcus sp. CA053C]